MPENVSPSYTSTRDTSPPRSLPQRRAPVFLARPGNRVAIAVMTFVVVLFLLFSFHIISIPSFLFGGQTAGYNMAVTNRLIIDQGTVYDTEGVGDIYAFQRSSGLVGPAYHVQAMNVGLACGNETISNGVMYQTTLISSGTSSQGVTASAVSLSDQKVLWQYPIGDASCLAPIVNDGVVYANGIQDGMPCLFAINTIDGKLIWRHKLQSQPGTALALVVANNVVYVGTNAAKVYALKLQDGTLLWQHAFSQASRNATKPLYMHNSVYIGIDNVLYALRTTDGHTLWQQTLDGQIQEIAMDGSTVYSGTDTGIVSAWNAQTGVHSWQQQLGNNVYHLLVSDNLVYISMTTPSSAIATVDGNVVALHKQDGSTVWQYKVGTQTLVLLASDGHAIYIALGEKIYALQAQTGHVLWQATIKR